MSLVVVKTLRNTTVGCWRDSAAVPVEAEVDGCRVAVLLNIAAVAMARQQFGAAVAFCGRALVLEPSCCKALLRRARAHLGRHEYRVCATCLPGPTQHAPCRCGGRTWCSS